MVRSSRCCCAGGPVQPVLCSAITASHLALGMPSGMLHVYEIEDLLDQVLVQQAKTVDKFSRSWQQERASFEPLKAVKSEGNVLHTCLFAHHTLVCVYCLHSELLC